MKSIYSLLFLIGLLAFACKNDPQSKTPEATTSVGNSGIHIDDKPLQKDTAFTNYIDSITFAVNKNMYHKPKHQFFDTIVPDKPDLEVGYFIDPSNSIRRILISENQHRILNIKYFFVKNGLPMLMHHRFWDKNQSPQPTNELYIYFDDTGKIVYAGERSTLLSKGEFPLKLKSIELTAPQKSNQELLEYVMEYWNIIEPITVGDLSDN